MELAGPPQPDVEVPAVVSRLAGGAPVRPVWRNELGGLTFELGGGPSGPGSPRRFVKWAPPGTADLPAEAARLRWAGAFTPVPPVLALSEDGDGDWLLTEALAGENAVSPRWLARPADAAEAIGAGLRAFHSALPVPDCPFRSTWYGDPGPGAPPTPPRDVVVCHGDACAPNTLIGTDGRWCGHVDLGALGVGDRWSDLAIATWSLDWNYGPGWRDALLAGYRIAPDPERMAHYRTLWGSAPTSC